jgi:hypothetical protein
MAAVRLRKAASAAALVFFLVVVLLVMLTLGLAKKTEHTEGKTGKISHDHFHQSAG